MGLESELRSEAKALEWELPNPQKSWLHKTSVYILHRGVLYCIILHKYKEPKIRHDLWVDPTQEQLWFRIHTLLICYRKLFCLKYS
jgi:hypothetical protein